MITIDNEWQWVTTNDNECYNEWQRMTKSGIEWQGVTANGTEWQGITTSGTTSDNEWQSVTKSDKEWQRVVQRVTMNTTSGHFG